MKPASVIAVLFVLAGLLAGCGGSDSGDDPQVKAATDAQIQTYLDSTKKDVAALEKALKASYQESKKFPETADDLGVKLSAHNHLKFFQHDDHDGSKVVRFCVEHVEKQPNPNNTKETVDTALAATDTSVGVYATGDWMKFTPGTATNSGCTAPE